MAGIKFLKGTEEWQLFMDYWNLCQKYWEPEEDDGYWEELVDASDKFYRKYNTGFARSLAAALVGEAERKKRITYNGMALIMCPAQNRTPFGNTYHIENDMGKLPAWGFPGRRGNGLHGKGTACRMAAAGKDKCTDSGNDRTER